MKNWKYINGAEVGNSMGKDIYQHKLDPNQYMVVDWDKDTVTIIVNGAVRDVIKSTDKVAYAVSHVYKKVNSMNKTGNETMHEWATSKPKNVGNTKVINSDREFFKELADDAKEREDKDKQEVEKLVENSKVGNVASEYEILKQDPSKMHPMYKKAYEEAMKKLAREDEEFKKRFEKEYGVKSKNEASDDKFAYVMREFDEGKLKTPDGKVVTDPAQAKAIAYSESKKTENGLARARNAMTGNGKTVYQEGPFKVVQENGSYVIYKGTKKIEEVPTLDEAIDDIDVWLYGND